MASFGDYMCIIKWAEKGMKHLDVWDISLIKISVFAFALLVAKFYPQILMLDWSIYGIIFVICLIRPLMHMLNK